MGMSLTPEGLRRGRKTVAAESEARNLRSARAAIYRTGAARRTRRDRACRSARDPASGHCRGSARHPARAHHRLGRGRHAGSDGQASIARGYQYIGITDHSKTAHYAGGLSVEEIEQQHAEIDRLNASFGGRFHIFKGIESDILPDGSLDYPEDVLRRFDFIIGSIHGQFRLDREAQTERLVRAASNPFVTVIGHMTGRQLLRRPGYEVDIERVLVACAEHGVAVEVNGNPWRLDLDWRWLRRGLELGCIFSINPDAHATGEIASSTRWGLAIARKSGMPADRVINALDKDGFRTVAARSQRADHAPQPGASSEAVVAARLGRLAALGGLRWRGFLCGLRRPFCRRGCRLRFVLRARPPALWRNASIRSEAFVGSGAFGGVILRPSIFAFTSSSSAAS